MKHQRDKRLFFCLPSHTSKHTLKEPVDILAAVAVVVAVVVGSVGLALGGNHRRDRWSAADGAHSPFEVRQVRIEQR